MAVHSPYVECPSCRFILHDGSLALIQLDNPCPKCGASGDARIVWPSTVILKFMEIVAAQDLKGRDGVAIATVFLATAYEAAFEQVLWRIVAQRTKDFDSAEAVIEEVRGIDRRLKFFRTLTKASVDQVWGTASLPVLRGAGADWSRLREKRNKIAHGHYYYSVTKDAEGERDLLERLLEAFLPAFAALENHVQAWVTNGPASTSSATMPGVHP